MTPVGVSTQGFSRTTTSLEGPAIEAEEALLQPTPAPRYKAGIELANRGYVRVNLPSGKLIKRADSTDASGHYYHDGTT